MGGCPLDIGDNFSLLSQSIFLLEFFIYETLENTIFIHAAQKCVSRRKNLKIVSGRQQQKVEKTRRASRYDQSKPFIVKQHLATFDRR